MPSSAASAASDRNGKRHKGGEPGNPIPPPVGSYHPGYGQLPPQQRYQQPAYGGPPPPHPPPAGQPTYGVQPPPPMWQPGQYGSQPPPPPAWQQQPGMYPQRGGPPITPDRGGSHWNGYSRGPPPPPPSQSKVSRRNGKQKIGGKSDPPPPGPIEGPPGQAYQGWNQWPHHQWGGGPPVWQSSGAPPPPPPPPPATHQSQPPMYSNQKMWGSGVNSPPRGSLRPRSSPEHMGNGMIGTAGYPPPPPPGGGVDSMCQPVNMDNSPPISGTEMDMYGTSRGVGPPHDDDLNGLGIDSSNSRDKGRGSYKCGRCGVPKKGHVCPYQPKLKRRPEDPPPELRNAAIQVEMDEFMTLRRLNIEIQGFPESYATEPYMSDDMVVGEPHPYAVASSIPCDPLSQGPMIGVDERNLADGSTPPGSPRRGASPMEMGPPHRSTPRASPASGHAKVKRDEGSTS